MKRDQQKAIHAKKNKVSVVHSSDVSKTDLTKNKIVKSRFVKGRYDVINPHNTVIDFRFSKRSAKNYADKYNIPFSS